MKKRTQAARVPHYLKGSWHLAAGGLLSMLAVVALRLAEPLVMKDIIDKAIPAKDATLMGLLALAYCGVVVLGGAFSYLRTMTIAKVGLAVVTKVKTDVFSKLLTLPVLELEKESPGALMARVESDGEKAKALFSVAMIDLAGNALFFLGMTGVMLTMNAPFAIAVIVAAPILGLAASRIFNLFTGLWEGLRKDYASMSGSMTEYVQGAEVLHAFNRVGWAEGKVNEVSHRLMKKQVRLGFLDFGIFGTTEFLLGPVFMAAVIWFLAPGVFSGGLTVGGLLVFLEYGRRLMEPILAMAENYRTLRQSRVALGRMFEILDRPSERQGGKEPTFDSEIEFRDVWFAYRGEDWVLRGVSFRIRKGTTVALVGASGSGKTTCVSLLAGFMEPARGEILVDGVPLRDLDLSAWRRKIGLVLQDIYLFPGSVLENVRIYDDSIGPAEVARSLTAAKADEFVSRLPEGVDSDLSERGGNLSLGERQLLSFARACAFGPEIVALDEATSSVDPRTEAGIREGMRELVEGRTAVIVAHRLSSIVHADEILYFKDGLIEERGRHADLYGKSARYRELVDLQMMAPAAKE